MRVVSVRLVIAFIALITLLQGTAIGTPAQATPEPEAEVEQSFRSNLPADFCTSDEIAEGDNEIVEDPLNGAEVEPAATPGRYLYFVRITLPPGSCVGYGSHYLHDGAIVWFVQEGAIEFAGQRIGGQPEPLITAMRADGTLISISGSPTVLAAGDWVAFDRAAEYSYRNAGTEDAVVMMAVNEVDPFGESVMRSCKGGCRKR
jgi:hypothetical protein